MAAINYRTRIGLQSNTNKQTKQNNTKQNNKQNKQTNKPNQNKQTKTNKQTKQASKQTTNTHTHKHTHKHTHNWAVVAKHPCRLMVFVKDIRGWYYHLHIGDYDNPGNPYDLTNKHEIPRLL